MGRITRTARVAAILMGCAAGLPAAAQADGFNWSGIYAGVEAGRAAANSDWKFLSYTNEDGITEVFDTPFGPPDDPSGSGGLLGVHAGYMHQTGGLVFGIDASWDAGKFKASQIVRSLAGNGAPLDPPWTVGVDVDSVAMIDARLGVANGRWLAYATGGLAFGRLHAASIEQCTNDGVPDPECGLVVYERGFSATGWNAGAGLAYAATDSVIVGVEYDHIDLGGSTLDLQHSTCPECSDFNTVRVHPTLDEVKARVSLKLGGQ
jgi:opacity protein-like surface antigen